MNESLKKEVKIMDVDSGAILPESAEAYDKYKSKIFHTVSKILIAYKLSGEIDDCVSLVFSEMVKNAAKYNPEKGNAEAFITVLARSTALNYVKKRGGEKSEPVDVEMFDFYLSGGENPDVGENLEYEELLKYIRGGLNKQESALFAMRYLYYLAPEDISAKLNIKRSAVDMRLSRLKAKVKDILTKKGYNLE